MSTNLADKQYLFNVIKKLETSLSDKKLLDDKDNYKRARTIKIVFELGNEKTFDRYSLKNLGFTKYPGNNPVNNSNNYSDIGLIANKFISKGAFKQVYNLEGRFNTPMNNVLLIIDVEKHKVERQVVELFYGGYKQHILSKDNEYIPKVNELGVLTDENSTNIKYIYLIHEKAGDFMLSDLLRVRGQLYADQLFKDTATNDGFSNILFLFEELLASVQRLHNKDYIHCDLKPDNIMISINKENSKINSIKLIDFGLIEKDKTPVDAYRGSFGYMFPNFILDIDTNKTSEINNFLDIYSLGVICNIFFIKYLYMNYFNIVKSNSEWGASFLQYIYHSGSSILITDIIETIRTAKSQMAIKKIRNPTQQNENITEIRQQIIMYSSLIEDRFAEYNENLEKILENINKQKPADYQKLNQLKIILIKMIINDYFKPRDVKKYSISRFATEENRMAQKESEKNEAKELPRYESIGKILRDLETINSTINTGGSRVTKLKKTKKNKSRKRQNKIKKYSIIKSKKNKKFENKKTKRKNKKNK